MTLDPRAVEWMNARIDGTISEENDAELTGLLNEEPGARERFEELRRLAERLDALEPVSPPSDLRAGVLAALRPLDRPAARRQERTRSVLRYAYAVAAGLVLGVLAYHLAASRAFQSAVLDPADVVGTMSPKQVGEGPMITSRVVEELPDGFCLVDLLRVNDHFSVTVSINTSDALDVVLDFDPADIAFIAVAQDTGQVERLAATASRIAWSQQGDHRLTLQFRLLTEGAATAELRLYRDEESLYETALQLPAPK